MILLPSSYPMVSTIEKRTGNQGQSATGGTKVTKAEREIQKIANDMASDSGLSPAAALARLKKWGEEKTARVRPDLAKLAKRVDLPVDTVASHLASLGFIIFETRDEFYAHRQTVREERAAASTARVREIERGNVGDNQRGCLIWMIGIILIGIPLFILIVSSGG